MSEGNVGIMSFYIDAEYTVCCIPRDSFMVITMEDVNTG